MATRDFRELMAGSFERGQFLCTGLDPVLSKIPAAARRDSVDKTLVEFCCSLVDACASSSGVFKPNIAFFERYREQGWRALRRIVMHINRVAPQVLTILDAKRGDIGNTNLGYVEAIFDVLGFDAVTLHCYMGREAMEPFLARADKGCIFMCKTSNPGAGEFQDLVVAHGIPLWLHVAHNVSQSWNTNRNCGLVLGATYPEEAARARAEVGDDIFFLVPGIGKQGGEVEAATKAARNSRGQGAVFNVSSDINYASDTAFYAEAAGYKAAQLSAELKAAMATAP